jgi:hypothetical protein
LSGQPLSVAQRCWILVPAHDLSATSSIPIATCSESVFVEVMAIFGISRPLLPRSKKASSATHGTRASLPLRVQQLRSAPKGRGHSPAKSLQSPDLAS